METWKEVRDFVIENFDGTYDSDTNTVNALLDVNRDRTQYVEITRLGDTSWVEISSCIGNVEKNDVLDLLEDLADETCGGVICRRGELYVRDTVRYEDIEEEGIEVSFYRVAKVADKLEKKYVGGDYN